MEDFKMNPYLIFGGTGQVGESVVKNMLKSGLPIHFTYHQNTTKARELENLGAEGHAVDLASGNAISELAQKFEKIEGLVIATGINTQKVLDGNRPGYFRTVNEWSDDLIDECLKLLVLSPYKILRHFHECMKPCGGNIILVNTLDGVKSTETSVFFSQCKSSIKGLVESSSREFGPSQIKVNQVCLGLLEGKTSDRLSHELKDKYLKHCGLGRLGRVEEVGQFISWMLLNNSYVTGQSIILDGAL